MKLVVEVTETQGTYRAKCTALPGCWASGPSRQLAVENLHRRIEGYLASMDISHPENVAQFLTVR